MFYRTLLFASIMIFLSLMVGITQHEAVHQKIYTLYGIDSYVDYGILDARTIGNRTKIVALAQNNFNDYKEMMKLHVLNEIVAYNLIMIELLLSIIIVLLVIVIGIFWESKHL
ncbi:MAG: hypothetical protein DRN14_02610 [Thermoplasmata archaeon]|nr:MAG: hypothetical protein DRN14_02610 [Thermoplasmata archaeon]